MGFWGDDIGLLYLVLLNAAVGIAAWRLARRRSADALDAAGDAFLIFYFVQYVSVCATGVAGAMHALTIGLVALLASAFIALGSWRIRPRAGDDEVGERRARDREDRDRREADRDDRERRDERDRRESDRDDRDRREGDREDQDRREGASDAATRSRGTMGRAEAAAATPPWRERWRARRARVVAVGAILFVVGYFASLVAHQRNLPVISNDAITYHLPAAVQWLQSGRIGLYEAWYYNPANSYSPLGGSAFIAWLIAPLQNDSIARFVAVGPLLMLLVAMLNLCRRVGLDAGVAALVAAACALARPFASQAILAKDDLFVAAFFVIVVDALNGARLARRSGPFRVGIALGLLLATKYTVLFSLPILLLMFNRAWTVRRMLVAAGVALIIAGPWYLRNVQLTGNPLYPTDVAVAGVTIFTGMMEVTRSHLLATPRGAWAVFVAGYYGLTRSIGVVLIAAWTVAAVCALVRRGGRSGPSGGGGDARARRAMAGPLVRTCVIGPVIGVGMFVAVAPYGEMRFAYPSVALLFACVAIALACRRGRGDGSPRLPWAGQAILAASFMLLAALTAFHPQMTPTFTAVGAAAALPGMLIAALAARRTATRLGLALGAVATLVLAGYAYVNWQSYVRQAEADSAVAWMNGGVYGAIGELWQFVRTDPQLAGAPRVGSGAGGGSGAGAGGAATPPAVGIGGAATIAYANTFFTYPLMGYRYEHRVVHVPTRRDVEHFRDLPRLPRKVSGEAIVPAVVAELRADPDRDAWLRRLRESGAAYLVVAKYDPAAPAQRVTPPEMVFAEQDPQRFVRIFDNDAGSVFRIVW